MSTIFHRVPPEELSRQGPFRRILIPYFPRTRCRIKVQVRVVNVVIIVCGLPTVLVDLRALRSIGIHFPVQILPISRTKPWQTEYNKFDASNRQIANSRTSPVRSVPACLQFHGAAYYRYGCMSNACRFSRRRPRQIWSNNAASPSPQSKEIPLSSNSPKSANKSRVTTSHCPGITSETT